MNTMYSGRVLNEFWDVMGEYEYEIIKNGSMRGRVLY